MVYGGRENRRKDLRTNGRLEIPRVLQDIGSLGPLPKKRKDLIRCRTSDKEKNGNFLKTDYIYLIMRKNKLNR